jgi:hypothetical protein
MVRQPARPAWVTRTAWWCFGSCGACVVDAHDGDDGWSHLEVAARRRAAYGSVSQVRRLGCSGTAFAWMRASRRPAPRRSLGSSSAVAEAARYSFRREAITRRPIKPECCLPMGAVALPHAWIAGVCSQLGWAPAPRPERKSGPRLATRSLPRVAVAQSRLGTAAARWRQWGPERLCATTSRPTPTRDGRDMEVLGAHR